MVAIGVLLACADATWTPSQIPPTDGLHVAHNRLGGMITAGVARTGRAVEHLLS